MTVDLVKNSERRRVIMQPTASTPLHLARDTRDTISSSSSSSCNSSIKRKMLLPTFAKCSVSGGVLFVILVVVLLDLPSSVHSSPLPSSSAWSLPTLNYLFKDTKTRSQSNDFKRGNANGPEKGSSSSGSHQDSSKVTIGNSPPSSQALAEGTAAENEEGNKVSTTGRLISAHDIRLTDNWGWVRRGASDPQTTTEQRRRQNIRHSKSKHKQRHHFASVPSSSSSVSSSSSGASSASGNGGKPRRKDKPENLLCPFDEIRGPDGKCRKAPRFSLYRVGRK